MAHIIVCGYMIRHPVAGNILAYFHYILGLDRLGYEVIYLEESGWDYSCYHLLTQAYSDDPSFGLQAVEALFNQYHVKAQICYINRQTGQVYGNDWDTVKQQLKTADLLLNIGGVCWLSEFLLCQRRVLIDMDPFFTQIGKFAGEGFSDYHLYFSYGMNIGQSDCTIPTANVDWLPIVPPVVPEIWNNSQQTGTILTTIGNWSAYGSVVYNNNRYGQKDEEFLRFLELPQLCSQKIEVALSGKNIEIAEIKPRLQAAGWFVENGLEVSANLSTYQSYIINSRGEFSVAKNAYVKTRSGWFSDRSVCYLAAGKPVILQDTGFSDWLPTGCGVLAFSTLAEAVDCIESLNADYSAHCRAAQQIAEDFFSYKVVLSRFL